MGTVFLNLVSRIFNDPARVHERLFARLGDNPSPVFASFLPYARRFELRGGDADPLFLEQLACFALCFLG